MLIGEWHSIHQVPLPSSEFCAIHTYSVFILCVLISHGQSDDSDSEQIQNDNIYRGNHVYCDSVETADSPSAPAYSPLTPCETDFK